MRAPESMMISFEKFFLDLVSEAGPDLIDPLVAIKLEPVLTQCFGVAYTMGFMDAKGHKSE